MYESSKAPASEAERLEKWADASSRDNAQTALVRFLKAEGSRSQRETLSGSLQVDKLVDVLIDKNLPTREIFQFAKVIEESGLSGKAVKALGNLIDKSDQLKGQDFSLLCQLVAENPRSEVIEGLIIVADHSSKNDNGAFAFLIENSEFWQFAFADQTIEQKAISAKCFKHVCIHLSITKQNYLLSVIDAVDLLIENTEPEDYPLLEQVIDALPQLKFGRNGFFAEFDFLISDLTEIGKAVGSQALDELMTPLNNSWRNFEFSDSDYTGFIEAVLQNISYLEPFELYFKKLTGCLSQNFSPQPKELIEGECTELLEEICAQSAIVQVLTTDSKDHYKRKKLASIAVELSKGDNPPFSIDDVARHTVYSRQTSSVLLKAYDTYYGFSGFTHTFRPPPESLINTRPAKAIDVFATDAELQVERSFTSPKVFPGDGWRILGLEPGNLFKVHQGEDVSPWEAALAYMQRSSLSDAPDSDGLKAVGTAKYYFFQGLMAITGGPGENPYMIEGIHYSLLVHNQHLNYQNLDSALLVPTKTLAAVLDPQFESPAIKAGVNVRDFYHPDDYAKPIDLGWSSNYSGGLSNGFQINSYPFHDWERMTSQWYDLVGHAHKYNFLESEEIMGRLHYAHLRVHDLAHAYFDLLDPFKIGLSLSAHGHLPSQLVDTFKHPETTPVLRQAADWISYAREAGKSAQAQAPVLVVTPIRKSIGGPPTPFVLDTGNRILWRLGNEPEFIDVDERGRFTSESVATILESFETAKLANFDCRLKIMDRSFYRQAMREMGAK